MGNLNCKCLKNIISKKNKDYEPSPSIHSNNNELPESQKNLSFKLDKENEDNIRNKKNKTNKANKTMRYARDKMFDEFKVINPEKNIIKKSSNNKDIIYRYKKHQEETSYFKRIPTKESFDEEPKENIFMNNRIPSSENLNKELAEESRENEDIKNKYFSIEPNYEKIKQDYSTLKSDNEYIKQKYSSLESNYEKIKQNYSNLQSENENIKKNILDFKNEINELKEKDKNLQNQNKEIIEQNILLEKEIKEKDILMQKNNEELQNQNKKIIEQNKLLQMQIKQMLEENLSFRKVPILVGLDDIGGIYFMNATLQCLSNTDELTEFFLNKFKYEPNDKNKIISNEYYNVIKNLWNRSNDNKSFSAKEFKEALSRENSLFSGIGTKASKDLINFLLERIHIELNDIKIENKIKKNNYMSSKFDQNNQFNEQAMLNIFTKDFKKEYNSIISHLFFGILETKSQCQRCKYFKYNFQVYNFIEFPLERINQYFFNIGKRLNYNMYDDKNPDIDLYECFEFHNKIEPMIGDNQLYCNNCQDNCDFLYQSSLYSTPKYLIINFFRGRGEVYECNVNFPEQLYLNNFVSNKNYIVYELYGVICQIDSGYMNGSFIAFCKNRIDKKWYKYNDDVVTLCENSNEFRIGMPYILFYKILFNN